MEILQTIISLWSWGYVYNVVLVDALKTVDSGVVFSHFARKLMGNTNYSVCYCEHICRIVFKSLTHSEVGKYVVGNVCRNFSSHFTCI